MGDRTYVNIKIKAYDFDKHEDFFRSDEVGADGIDRHGKIVEMYSYEVNYAEWGELEDFLIEEEIEYDKYWADGGDYESGNQYARKIRKEYCIHEIYGTQESILSVLKELQEAFDKDPKKGKSLLKKKIKEIDAPFEIRDLGEENSLKFIKEA